MKLSEYLKDRLPAVFISLGTLALVLIFLSAFRIPVPAIAATAVLLGLGAVSVTLWDYFRRRRFYSELNSCLEELEEKYLLAEVLDEPEFLEGRLICNAVREADRAMYSRIAELERQGRDFREYIELWVHEVKLPVAGLQLMCHNDGSTRYTEQLQRLDDLIENVLYYARSGSAEKDYLIKKVPLQKAFSEVAVRYRSELQERGIGLSAEGLDVSVMTDEKWLCYILGQLIANSIRYVSDERRPEITVRAEDFPDKTVLRFRDNGIGIPETDLPYIFEKSFTGQNGRSRSRSTGMGLYIADKLCRRLGHSISADSVRGSYTEISITFGKNRFIVTE